MFLFPPPFRGEGLGWGVYRAMNMVLFEFIRTCCGENAISTARSSVSSAEPLSSPNALASKSMTCVIA